MSQAILYVQRNGIYYKNNIKDSPILHYNFLPAAICDLDIIDSKVLTNSIKTFIDNNKLSTSECIIIISESVYFEKDYIGITKEEELSAIQLFIDNIPFENVLSKTFLIENGIKVVVANKDFCLALKSAFDDNGLQVIAISPAVSVGIREIDDITASFNIFFDKYDFIKQNNFPLVAQQAQLVKNYSQQQIKHPGVSQKQSNKRIFVLIGFFILLIGILITMLLSNQ